MDHFTIDAKQNIPELGQRGTVDLRRLRSWLFGQNLRKENWTYRLAPSIVTRGEAELFGLSMPRFAVRVYLKGNTGMFVNARRTRTFCDQARRWGHPLEVHELDVARSLSGIYEAQSRTRPAWLLRKNRCIADSVLNLPAESEKWAGFKTLSVELGRAYGEGEDLEGFPYVMHTRLAGGGLCAQAACFMSSVLMGKEAKAIWGPADITWFASEMHGVIDAHKTNRAAPDSAEARVFAIGGLNLQLLASYFLHDRVGLNAVWQEVYSAEDKRDQKYPICNRNIYSQTLRSYLRSKIPVIIPLDLGRMAGQASLERPVWGSETIFQTNNLDSRNYMSRAFRQQRHAVVLIGVHETLDKFLVNDPATRPCLITEPDQLWEAACYLDDKAQNLLSGWILPVMPEAVRVPLQRWRPINNLTQTVPNPGLWQVAEHLSLPKSWLPRLPFRYDVGQFQLTRLSGLQAVLADFVKHLPDSKTLIHRIPCELQELGIRDNKWLWVQFSRFDTLSQRAMLCIWDAEAEAPKAIDQEDPRRLLRILYLLGTSEWKKIFSTPMVEAATTDLPISTNSVADVILTPGDTTPQRENFCTSLITSFSTRGIMQRSFHWPSKIKQAEAYCFLQPDAQNLLPIKALCSTKRGVSVLGGWLRQFASWTVPAYLFQLNFLKYKFDRRPKQRLQKRKISNWFRRAYPLGVCMPVIPAVDRMAAVFDNERIQHAVAKKLADTVGKNAEIRVLASFLPEIACPGAVGQRATDALQFLIGIAKQLQHLDPPHRAHTIEMVSGSRIVSLWRGHRPRYSEPDELAITDFEQQKKIEVYAGSALSVNTSLNLLLERLRSICPEAEAAKVRFAVELEPGPLYPLGDQKSLELFYEKLELDEILSRTVGLNLDIAHWELAGLHPETISESVRRKIIHCHISDHGLGHYGDAPLLHVHKDAHFIKWLAFLKETVFSNPKADYSGTVSIELEACKSAAHLKESEEKLYTMLL